MKPWTFGGLSCSRSDRFAITSHRSRNLVKPISSSAVRVSLLLCGQCRLVAGTIGLATHHNRPDDPCCLVCHRDGCKPHGLSRQLFMSSPIPSNLPASYMNVVSPP